MPESPDHPRAYTSRLDLKNGPRPSSLLPAVGAGAGAALVGALVWAGIAALGYEVGWLAWGIGALVGLVMLKVDKGPSSRLGVAAGGVAFLGLVVGKILAMQWGLVPAVVEEFAQDPQTLDSAMYHRLVAADSVDPEVVAFYAAGGSDQNIPEELQPKIAALNKTVAAQLRELTDEGKADLVRPLAKAALAEASLVDKLDLGLFDVLWVFLAVGTAWRIGMRRKD